MAQRFYFDGILVALQSIRMSVESLLQDLDLWHEGIPEELLTEAVERQEEVTPGLISAIADTAQKPSEYLDHPERNLYYWAAYLLTHFEEPTAQGALIDLFRLCGGPNSPLVDDLVNEDGGMILANTAGGNIGPICDLLQDRSLAEPVRFAAADAIGFLCAWGELDAEIVENEYRKALLTLEKKDSFLAMEIVNNASDLNLRGLAPDITRAYDRGVVEVDDYEMVAEWLHDPDFEPPPPFLHLNQAIDDIVDFFHAKLEEERMMEEALGDEDGKDEEA